MDFPNISSVSHSHESSYATRNAFDGPRVNDKENESNYQIIQNEFLTDSSSKEGTWSTLVSGSYKISGNTDIKVLEIEEDLAEESDIVFENKK